MAKRLIDPTITITAKDSELLSGGDPDTTYTLRPLTTEKHREIVRLHTRKEPDRRTRAMQDVTDWAAVTDDLVDYVVASWIGILDGAEPAACTRENKMRLDAPTKDALLERAGLNEIVKPRDAEDREASFRQSA
jgi:hypothetical protein